ncbi:MAG TPA: hypothetical protein DCX25_04155 [Candidatus Pacebacteria bacterium]|nr:MAG: hypothetical protein UX00_C0012G0006 [Microgenomates group bacterium GW2011_GWB1_45_17]KKU23504.1 MAG: hypothetical protein UX35_C0005G0006 [Microgenomates group bacterium GW2011_GWA1_46_15]KKU24389.1 MAG: hypothetical protein UX36_C0001G0006 [Microgenomates group bacterium GW2011_GWC1_46_15]HAV15495.1 hypothetical protein [Candidatus Paceibacterota bacterium]HCR10820.1 hypothetical protein [Candidatus Paceibacterota bacterium]
MRDSLIFALAYLKYGIDTVARTPSYIVLCVFITITLIATAFRWDSAILKTHPLMGTTSPSAYLNAIHFLVSSYGDRQAAEVLAKQIRDTKELDGALHPENRIKNLETFWQSVATQQANAREALFALAIIHVQLYEDAQAKESAQHAMLVEPNDPRRNQVLREILQKN